MDTLKVEQLSIQEMVPKLTLKLNFSLQSGECLSISGPSGLGKSMLLKAIADIIPHQGEISLGSLNSKQIDAPLWRQKVMLVPADSQWWFNTVAEHFDYPERVDFASLGFNSEILQRDIHHLSSGEKQRLSILRALQYQPEVLLLDEPTANLDQQSTQAVEQLILNYIQHHEKSVLWVGHDLEQLQKISRRMLKLSADQVEEIRWPS